MGIAEERFNTVDEVFTRLNDLANDPNIIFRGQSNPAWRLSSTLHRFYPERPFTVDAAMDNMLAHFLASLISVGAVLPQNPRDMDRRARLEYARHYGVPSPLIDFTRSPYVAMFFAFDGVKATTEPAKESAIYALNIGSLAFRWAAELPGEFQDHHAKFWAEGDGIFTHAYPANLLKFIRFPASWNRRMQKQMGVFLYDSLNYLVRKPIEDLEGYIDAIREVPTDDNLAPTLIKVFISQRWAPKVFERLELMGMTGIRLLDDHVGAAKDVINAYNYPRRTGYAWDTLIRDLLKFPGDKEGDDGMS